MNTPKFLTFIVVALAGALSAESAAAATAVVAWGSNSYGQTNVPPGLTNIVAISANELHTVALRADGTVVSWGVGDNRTNVPPGLSNVVAVAAGGVHSVAVKRDGTVAAWSCCGSLWGLTNVPPGLTNVVRVTCGYSCVLALKGDGSVVSWGDPDYTNLPPGLAPVTAIAAGNYHNLAIKPDGTVVAWGDNTFNQTNVPTGLSNVIAVAAGQGHSLALRRDGTVVGWGFNNSQQATPPSGLSNVVAIAAGSIHSMALKSDGTLVPWGDPSSGQNNIPPGATNVSLIADGSDFSVAVTGRLPPGTNANLAGLVLSAGTLTPTFDPAVTNYTASACPYVASTAVTATSTDTNATVQVRVNGSTFSNLISGTASPPLPLNVGTNLVDVRVTAQDLTTMKTYTVAVSRAGPGGNHPPVANAGGDRTVYTTETVILAGSASDPDCDAIVGWLWQMSVVPPGANWTLTDEDTITPDFTANTPGDYVLSLIVMDSRGALSAPDYATIHAHSNLPPVAVATADATNISVGGTVCFDGSQSSDPEAGPLTYVWDFGDDSPAVLGTNRACHTFTMAGTYNVRLLVDDERLAGDFADITIYVFASPLVVATANPVSGPSSLPVQFDGSQSRGDTSRTLTSFLWNFGDGTTSTNISPTHQFAPGLYNVTLTVTDDLGGIGTNSLQILAGHNGNWPPVVDAGTNQFVRTNTTTQLDGSAIDADGNLIVLWAWTVLTVPANAQYVLADPSDPHSAFTAQTHGSYLLSLVASDGTDTSLPDTVTIWVEEGGGNLPPVANAGEDRSAYTAETIILTGSATDPDGDAIVGWLWQPSVVPPGANWTLSSEDTSTPYFTANTPGDYILSLIVLDSRGAISDPDYATIYVMPAMLQVALTSTNTVLLAWPAVLTGYGLQQNADLTTTNWLAVTNTPVMLGSENQVIVSPSGTKNFYRLRSN